MGTVIFRSWGMGIIGTKMHVRHVADLNLHFST